MNPIEALVRIQIVKAQAIKKFTDIPYMLPKDYEELISCPTELAWRILFEMRHLYKIKLIGDSKVCPWCIETDFSDNFCIRCKYAGRHGDCNNISSDYSRIIELANCGLVELPRVNLKIQKILKEV